MSFFPGTTLRSKEVENVKIGTRVGSCEQVFDTPGLPTANRAIDQVRDAKKLKSVMMTKEPSLSSVRLDEGGAVWFGGLARLDLVRGPSVAVVSWLSNEISVSRYTTAKANMNYLKSFGSELFPTYGSSPADTVFERHEVCLVLDMAQSVHREEIAIYGLGALSLRELPKTRLSGQELRLSLYLPRGVDWCLRPALLGIQDAAASRLTTKLTRRPSQREFT